jgi:hypothetical protein
MHRETRAMKARALRLRQRGRKPVIEKGYGRGVAKMLEGPSVVVIDVFRAPFLVPLRGLLAE